MRGLESKQKKFMKKILELKIPQKNTLKPEIREKFRSHKSPPKNYTAKIIKKKKKKKSRERK